MKIYITRHSKTLWNEEKRLQGWQDSPLTKQGEKDAKQLGERVKDLHIDQIYSSPIERAYQTAKLVFPKENIITDDRIKEMNFGDYEGLCIADLKNNKDYFDLWHFPKADSCLPNGETYQEVVDRLKSFINEKYTEDPTQTIFMTIHGMLFTILHGIACNLPIERFNEVNTNIVRGCSLSEFDYDGKGYKIVFIGNDDYLDQSDEIIKYD